MHLLVGELYIYQNMFYGLVLIETKQYFYCLRPKFHFVETGHAVVKMESVTNVSAFEIRYVKK